MGGVSLRLAGLHSLPPELQRDELQLRASIGSRCLASLIHWTAVSDSQVRKPRPLPFGVRPCAL